MPAEPLPAICEAARQGDLAAVQALVAAGADVNQQGPANRTPLHEAASYGHHDVVKWLLSKGAKVNAKSLAVRGEDAKATPLHRAVDRGHASVTALLLAHGANPNLKKSNGYTALMSAVELERLDLISLLLAHGADITLEEMTGATALDCAINHGFTDAIELILNHGFDINRTSTVTGRTPLMEASSSGFPAIVAQLLAKGAEPNIIDSTGRTALLHCVEGSGATIAKGEYVSGVGLVELPRQPTDPTSCVRLLLEAGADPSLTSQDSRTPLQVAKWLRVQAIQEMLVKALSKPGQ
jgi:ankyrin repeat protein